MRISKKRDHYWDMDINEVPKLEQRINGGNIKPIKKGFRKYLELFGEDFRVSLTGYFALLYYMEQTTTDEKINLNAYETLDKLAKNRLALNSMAYDNNTTAVPLVKQPQEELITWYNLLVKHVDLYVADRFNEYLLDQTQPLGSRPIDMYLHEAEAKDTLKVNEATAHVINALGVSYFHALSDTLYNVYKDKHPKEVYDLGKVVAEQSLERLLSDEDSIKKDLFEVEKEGEGNDDTYISKDEAKDLAKDLRLANQIHKDLITAFLGGSSNKVKKRLYASKGVINYAYYEDYFLPFLQSLKYEVSEDSIRLMALLYNKFDTKTTQAISEYSHTNQ